MNSLTDRLHNNLMQSTMCDYLLNRGLTIETIKDFKIGLALSKKEELSFLLQNKDLHIEFGNLTIHHERGLSPRFTQRVMIPIADHLGEFVGYTGRYLTDLDDKYLSSNQRDYNKFVKSKGYTPSKYLNTGTTLHFKKSEILFNMHRVQTKYVYIVEAQLSAIGVTQCYNRNTIATGGTAFTEKHVSLLKLKGITHVCLCMDADKAGRKATYLMAIKLINNGFVVKVALLPKGKDPMDFIALKEEAKLIEILTNPIDGLRYLNGYFNHAHKELSKFKFLLEVKRFFEEINISNSLHSGKLPNTKLGWFLNRELERLS